MVVGEQLSIAAVQMSFEEPSVEGEIMPWGNNARLGHVGDDIHVRHFHPKGIVRASFTPSTFSA
jgi:hypothetical protein